MSVWKYNKYKKLKWYILKASFNLEFSESFVYQSKSMFLKTALRGAVLTVLKHLSIVDY